MITPRMGTAPVAQLRRTISSTQIKALDVLRQLRSSTRPPPLLPPHVEDAAPVVVIPPEKDPEKK